MSEKSNAAELLEVPAVVQQIAELYAARAAQAISIEGTPTTIVPPGFQVHKHEELREQPTHTVRDYVAHTAESFIQYVNRFADGDTMVFVDLESARAVAVLDYDAPSEGDINGARWGYHRAVYTFPRTPEARAWLECDGQRMTQTEFAHFIEQHTPEMIDPPGADMLEIALTLEANTKVGFQSGQRLDNGQVQLTYQEEIDGRAGARGQFKIPSEFITGIQLFKGGDVYQVDARLRYRIREGQLSMWYELIRPQRVLEDAVTQIAETISESLEQGTLVYGALAGER